MEVVPGVMLEASLEDVQGRFNLNNLISKDGTPDQVYVDGVHQAAGDARARDQVGADDRRLDRCRHRAAERRRCRGQCLHGTDASLPDRESLHHEHERAARAAGLRAGSLPHARALYRGTSEGHPDQRVHREETKCSMHSCPRVRPSSARAQGQLEKNRVGTPGCFPTLGQLSGGLRRSQGPGRRCKASSGRPPATSA